MCRMRQKPLKCSQPLPAAVDRQAGVWKPHLFFLPVNIR
jgi:hypothetical protein